jgi:hypothetical protein
LEKRSGEGTIEPSLKMTIEESAGSSRPRLSKEEGEEEIEEQEEEEEKREEGDKEETEE